MPTENLSPEEAHKLLEQAKTIAIVGLSNEPEKDSYRVAAYLQAHGYRIIPVNPKYPEILGEKAYPALTDIPHQVDIVDVFRRADAVPDLARAALEMSPLPKGFWMQLGITHTAAASMLQKAGIAVVQDQCIKIVHGQFLAR